MKEKSKVILFDCNKYNLNIIRNHIYKGFEILGGIDKYIKEGMTVFIKPNMLGAKEPERGITTHPVILEALINIIKEVNAIPVFGDSPAGSIKGGMKRFWKTTGYLKLSERTNTELINIEKAPKECIILNGKEYYLSKPILKADLVINVPKLKTHFLTIYTGSIKNMYGSVPGLKKSYYHKIAPNPESFSEIIADVYSIIKPQITVMDGILTMDGNGPSSGGLNWMNLIAMSNDGVALDRICEEIIGLNYAEIKPAYFAQKRGAGNYDINKIDLFGDNISIFKKRKFVLPSNRMFRLIPNFIGKFIAPLVWTRPKPDINKCTFCKVCIESCPVEAMSPDEENKLPVIDYDKCILCNCCNEVCPEGAIFYEFSILAKLIK